MFKCLPLFTSFFLVIVSQAFAQQPPSPEKIMLSPSMVVNESGHGDASLLVDEQALSGDPLAGNGGSPQTYWFPGWQTDIYPASAYIDLGGEYELSDIFLYDFTGKADFTLEIGEPGNWTHLLTDGMESYNSWNMHDVVVTTRYVRVARSTAGGNMNEIVLYGRPSSNSPPVITTVADQTVTVGNVLSIPLSATDADGDQLSFSLHGVPGFVSLSDNGDGTAVVMASPSEGDEGSHGVTVSVSDVNGGEAGATFVLTVEPAVVLMPTAPVDMVRNRPVDGGNGQ